MRRIFLLFYLIFFLSCSNSKIIELRILLVSFNKEISPKFFDLIKSHLKEKYHLKLFAGNVFKLDKNELKKQLKIINKLKADIFLPGNDILKCDLKKIRKYQRICRYPLIFTNPPFDKKVTILFKPFFMLSLLKFKVRIYNVLDLNAQLNISESILGKILDKDVSIIFSDIKEKKVLEKIIKFYNNKIYIIKDKNIAEPKVSSFTITVNPYNEIVGEIKILYDLSEHKILKLEFNEYK